MSDPAIPFSVFESITSSASQLKNKEKKNNADTNYSDFGTIASFDEFSRLSPAFNKLLIEKVGKKNAIYVCPAMMKNQRITILHTPEHKNSDLYHRIMALIEKEEGHVPEPIEMSATLLLTLVFEGGASYKQNEKSLTGASQSALSQAFTNIVTWAVDNHVSDIHINIDQDNETSQIYATIEGHYVAPRRWRLPTAHLLDIAKVAWLGNQGGKGSMLDLRSEQQGRLFETIRNKPYMLRWGSFIADSGPSITLRLQDLEGSYSTQSFEEMGYLPSQAQMLHRAQVSEGGAIVLGGVPGSGKTTTLANLLSELPRTRKIMTIEDPVERRIAGALQATISRGSDGDGDHDPFHSKLMMLKRSAPSDVFLGEIRDTVTGRAFQDITESGTNLYSTVHAISALSIAERLASRQIGVPLELLSMPNVLKLVGYQALLPTLCQCALPITELYKGSVNAMGQEVSGDDWRKYVQYIETSYEVSVTERVLVRNSQGCPKCKGKELPELYGYKGRTVAAELFELGQYRDALIAVRNRDVLTLTDFYESLRVTGFDDPDMTGKTAMDAAVYKMLQGTLDPRDIEPRFQSFESVYRSKMGSKGAKL